MIGIIAALRVEIQELKELVTDANSRTVAGVEFVSGVLDGKDVVMAECGAGKVNAAMCAQLMISEFSPDMIINTGVAGSLTKELGIGDAAVAETFVQHDFDTTGIGDPKGYVGVAGDYYVDIPCDAGLVYGIFNAAEGEGLKARIGQIATGDLFVCSRTQKKHIHANYPNAIACEMEGAAIAQVCLANNVMCAAIRTISDTADDCAGNDFPSFARKAAALSIAVIRRFMYGI